MNIMKLNILCSFFVLIITIGVECLEEHKALIESESEIVYRVTRGFHGNKKRGGECRYKKGPWEECNTATNMQQRSLTLKRGDSSCEATKVASRKCKKACRYEKGEWSPCNTASNTRVRNDRLKPGSDPTCDSVRMVTKKCKKNIYIAKTCRYDRQAEWSPCDPTTGQKSKVMRLQSGMSAECEPTKVVSKPCQAGRKGGKYSDDDYEDDK